MAAEGRHLVLQPFTTGGLRGDYDVGEVASHGSYQAVIDIHVEPANHVPVPAPCPRHPALAHPVVYRVDKGRRVGRFFAGTFADAILDLEGVSVRPWVGPHGDGVSKPVRITGVLSGEGPQVPNGSPCPCPKDNTFWWFFRRGLNVDIGSPAFRLHVQRLTLDYLDESAAELLGDVPVPLLISYLEGAVPIHVLASQAGVAVDLVVVVEYLELQGLELYPDEIYPLPTAHVTKNVPLVRLRVPSRRTTVFLPRILWTVIYVVGEAIAIAIWRIAVRAAMVRLPGFVGAQVVTVGDAIAVPVGAAVELG